MTDKVREQIMKIRESGRSNMLDIHAVQRLAYESEFYDLVMYIEEHRREYWNFIMTGREKD